MRPMPRVSGKMRQTITMIGERHERQDRNGIPHVAHEPSRGAEHPDQRRLRRNMRRPLSTPDVRRDAFEQAGRLDDVGELHALQPGQHITAEPFRVVHGPRVRLFPFCERSIVRT